MKILIVDDHPVIIAGCSAMFAAESKYDVVDASNADGGYEAYLKHKPDLCILDISLPGKSGYDLTHRILEQNKKAKIIIFSMNDDPVFASRALNLGARGYVTKNDNPYILLEAIKTVMEGKLFIMPKMAEALSSNSAAKKDDIWTQLTDRERQIFKLLGAGQDLREIADTVGVSHKTIANACSIIKNKFGLRSIAELTQKAFEYKGMI
jgi:DNA-binding NarL/FixJ family response regulator